MKTDDIRSIAMQLPHATEDVKWKKDLCFSIAGKMFSVTSLDNAPVTVSFKVHDDEFEEVSARPGFIPAPYVARYKWVLVEDIRKVSRKELEYFIRQSYNLVKENLPKTLQASLNDTNHAATQKKRGNLSNAKKRSKRT